MKKKVINPFQMRAAFEPATFSESDRTVEIVVSTDKPVLMQDWDGPFNEILSMKPEHVRMERINNGAPLLNTHNRYDLNSVLGVIEKAWLAGKELRGLVRFSEREDVVPIMKDVKDGIMRNISVGYRVYKYEKAADGEEQIPTLVAIDWEPYEASLVPVPADYTSTVRSATREDTPNPVEIVEPEPPATTDPPVDSSGDIPPTEDSRLDTMRMDIRLKELTQV